LAGEITVGECDIFHAAREISDPAGRSNYLEKACAGNPAQKRLVENMLRVYPQLGNFLETPVLAGIAAKGTALRAGRFELGEELARGGMGIVYRARDDMLDRDVAVKVLHERFFADSLFGDRFLDEARITAQLQHPAIPPVFEVGRLADDRPYLAMKLIKGRTLEKLLSERCSPADERGQFLSVFQQVCQAVSYAHSRRILHRDLKTANVMVGAFGEVQVMDWGLAKLLEPRREVAPDPASTTKVTSCTVIRTACEREFATQAGSMLGTPAFMSPEQAGGELDKLDERSDVFGLGAILCVILTGQPPYPGKSVEEVGLMAIRGTLADAHARLDDCGADATLVELCRQCLAADRDSRPRDAATLAGALAEYMTGVEERARRAEVELAAAETKATEQRKRRRVQFALAATVLVLVGLVGFGLWSQERTRSAAAADRAERESRDAQRIREQKEIAEANATEASRQREIAEANEKTAAERQAETQAMLDFVKDKIIAAAQPSAFGGLGRDVPLSHALEVALPHVEQSFRQQPLIEARLRWTLGNSFFGLGKVKAAADQYDRARAIYTQKLGPEHPNTLGNSVRLAMCYRELGRYAEAVKLCEDSLAASTAKHGRDYPLTLWCMDEMGMCYRAAGRQADRLRILEESAALHKAKLGVDDHDTLWSMYFLAMCYREAGRYAEAAKLHEETLALRKAKSGPEAFDTLWSMNELGLTYRALGRNAEALKLLEETLALRRANLGPDHPDTLMVMNDLANCYLGLGRRPEALQLYKQTLALRKSTLGTDHPGTLVSMRNLALCYRYGARDGDAVKLMEEALAAYRAKFGVDYPETLEIVIALVVSYADAGRRTEALKLCEETLPLFEAKFGPGHLYTLTTIYNVACLHATLMPGSTNPGKEADLAINWLKKAVAAGFKDIALIKSDPDLNALRGRDDFKKLVNELEANTAVEKK
jgi:tetratricopeptide (TPR) repeat protein/tRNA A-37 threonylcarbamoyl transferase component Bud32